MDPLVTANFLLVIATFALAGITGYYAWQTRELVEENRRMTYENKIDRYIKLLDKKLEKLYIPLSNIGVEILYVLREMLMGESSYIECYENLKKINERLDVIRHYTYLANDKLKKDLEAFLVKLSVFIMEFEFIKYEDKMQKELMDLISKLDKILSTINEDIKKYRNLLAELIETQYRRHDITQSTRK